MFDFLAFRLAHALRGSRSLSIYREIRREPWFTPDEVKRRQFERARALVIHAEKTVPYYRELFREHGINSADIRSFEDFARIPILTKDILRERKDDLVSSAAVKSDLIAKHSGGSTGVPVEFYHPQSYRDASDAGTYRNLSQCGWSPGEMVAFFWGFNERLDSMPRWQFELRQRLRRFYQLDPFKSGEEDMALWLRRWGSISPRVALGYASTIARFAEYLLSNNATLLPLRGVFTTAEKLYDWQREQIERAFQCKVFDLYGSSEVQNIASECPNGRMHINSDFCVLETEGSTLVGPRPFLVTSLKQWAMPFIRYRNEDCGELLAGTCDCGRGFPLLSLEVSRLSDNFVLPGGRIVHGEFFTHLMYGSKGIANFQFHQTAIDKIVLRIVATPDSAVERARTLQSVTEQIRSLADGRVILDVQEVKEIELSRAGKHRFTRSDLASTNAE